MSTITIIPADPIKDGRRAGKALGAEMMHQRTREALANAILRDTVGAMSRAELAQSVIARLETPPDYGQYPELEDIYPERLDYLRGLAQGADVPLADAAVYHYLQYRLEIDGTWQMFQYRPEPTHCSGVFFNGPDGVIGGQSAESGPPPKPEGYRWRAPKLYAGLKQLKTRTPKLTVVRPRTGYIENVGVGNEMGVSGFCGVSCGTLLDDPIEDTWPICTVPLMRFAASVREFAALFERYTLFNWGRGNMIFGDRSGDAVAVEKSFRRIGLRWIGDGKAMWVTEGHFATPEMSAFIHGKRLEYLAMTGRHLGSEDMQYATDSAVRFTRLAELCHAPWGHGYEHIRRVLTDHAPFPRAICRHGGPDTAPYDQSITMGSGFSDLTHNRSFSRSYIPWKKFPCEMPEVVTQYPAWSQEG